MRGQVLLKAHWRIIVQEAAAAFTEHQLFAVPQILEKLRTQYDLTSPAASVLDLGHHCSVPFLANAFVVPVGLRFQARDQGLAFGPQLLELLLIHGGTLAGTRFLRFNSLFLFFRSEE